MSRPALLADCVRKRFGERVVLSSASLRAVSGEVRVLFGRNGIGKSTLLKIAAGVIRSDSGAVHLGGDVLLTPTLPQLARRGVFYLPDHELLSRSLPLGAQLRLVEQCFGVERAAEAARVTDVEQFLEALPSTLSGGELRRAELALAYARQPAVLLADEPFRGIAPVDHDRLAAIFRTMAAAGCAVVVTGHEYETLMAMADHITWCTAGTTYELGPPSEARRHEAFRREYAMARR